MNRWRVLVVGIGSIGRRHARVLQRAGITHLGLCDPDPRKRRAARALFPNATLYSDISQALQIPWTAAVVGTPAHLHVPIARQLVQRGIHVLIEKPVALQRPGLKALQQQAARHGCLIAVAYVYRCHPALQHMRRLIRSGRLGPPVQLVACSGQHFPHYRPDYRRIYYARRETGGGAIQDALPHLLDAGHWLVGPATRVLADAQRLVLPGVQVEDTVHVLARHGTILASYALNQHQYPNEWTITVHCRHGTARFHYHAHCCLWMERPEGRWRRRERRVERDELFLRQWRCFRQAVLGRQAPLCSLAEAAQTLETTLAIQRSIQSGRWNRVRQGSFWQVQEETS